MQHLNPLAITTGLLLLCLGTSATGAPAPSGAALGETDSTPAALRVVPGRIAFQGFLTDSAGNPVNGPVDLRLKLWNAVGGGSTFWLEDHLGVVVTDGVFAVAMGSETTLSSSWFDGAPMWVSISVNGGADLSPRTELLTAPFAFHATSADHALTADSASLALDDLTDVNAAAPGTGQVLQYNGFQWTPGTVATGSDGDWNISGNNLISAVSGNVVIGGGSPTSKLVVSAASTQYALQVQNLLGTSASFLSPSAVIGGTLVVPAAIRATAAGTDDGAFFRAENGVALIAQTKGTGAAIRGWDFGGLGLAGDFDGDVEISDNLSVTRDVTADSLRVRAAYFQGNVGIGLTTPSERLTVSGNVFASGGDLYTAAGNGVFNAGGGVMNSLVNVIADNAPTLSVVNGDEDLYIEDNLEVGGNAWKPGGGSWQTLSDVRVKKDIRTFEPGLDTVLKIHPIWFRYNDRTGFADGREHVGVSAQDMMDVAPFMVEERAIGQVVREDASGKESIVDPGETYYAYDSSSLVYMLVNAVQEQQRRIDALEARIAGQ